MHVQHPKGNSSNPSSIPKNPIDGQKTHSVRKKYTQYHSHLFPNATIKKTTPNFTYDRRITTIKT